jgi:hypothetical protein
MKFKIKKLSSLDSLYKKILILFQKIKIKSEKVNFLFKKIIKINNIMINKICKEKYLIISLNLFKMLKIN